MSDNIQNSKDDLVTPFHLEGQPVRGRIVRDPYGRERRTAPCVHRKARARGEIARRVIIPQRMCENPTARIQETLYG